VVVGDGGNGEKLAVPAAPSSKATNSQKRKRTVFTSKGSEKFGEASNND
jgi:hypothetical protein